MTETRLSPISLWGGPADPPCVLRAISERACEHPARIAVADEEGSVTYRELLGWAERIAQALQAEGVVPDDLVAVTGRRGTALVAALLGLLRLGAAYVPLDPEYPRRRLEFMLQDSAAKLLLHAGSAPDIGTSARTLAVPEPTAADDRGTLDSAACAADRATYVIYTSGSTGVPKGVAVAHRCLDGMAQWQAGHSPRPDLRTAQFAPLNFDVYFQEVLGTLSGGGTLVVMPERLRRDPFRLLAWIREQRIERLFAPYVALHMLALAASAEDSLADLALLEVNTAGEQVITTPPIRELFARLPSCRLTNHYGQSESAMVSAHVLPPDPAGWPDLPPIGVPLPGCEVLVDPVDPECPEVGELLVAGLPMSAGYLHRPELTAQRYVEIPPTPHGHVRAFRTADLVRVQDGVLHFLSRLDQDVKVRGYRVNPLEAEARLIADPAVTAAACVVLEGNGGARSLHAAVTLRPDAGSGEEADPDRLSAALTQFLPAVAVPSSITVLAEMPRTPSGKIDRARVIELIARR